METPQFEMLLLPESSGAMVGEHPGATHQPATPLPTPCHPLASCCTCGGGGHTHSKGYWADSIETVYQTLKMVSPLECALQSPTKFFKCSLSPSIGCVGRQLDT